jgi:hypothetical protein
MDSEYHCFEYDHCDECGACRFGGHRPKVVKKGDRYRCLCLDCYEKEQQ